MGLAMPLPIFLPWVRVARRQGYEDSDWRVDLFHVIWLSVTSPGFALVLLVVVVGMMLSS